MSDLKEHVKECYIQGMTPAQTAQTVKAVRARGLRYARGTIQSYFYAIRKKEEESPTSRPVVGATTVIAASNPIMKSGDVVLRLVINSSDYDDSTKIRLLKEMFN